MLKPSRTLTCSQTAHVRPSHPRLVRFVCTKDKSGVVTHDEFKAMVQECKPTMRWPKKIAVAFSGGPDSTSLLYLLRRLVSTREHTLDLPQELVAITIDHGLQSNSAEVARRCAEFSDSLQIPHRSLTIPWSSPPFPYMPAKTEAVEHVARYARYHQLFQAMQNEGADIIAFGHHIDDQVETALLRIARGSTEVGAGGMRRCRRWGMGFGNQSGELGWAGYAGMNKWIVRPLLKVSKDRLLLTCKENSLPYVEDPTNFQPDLTPRNAIRDALEKNINRGAPLAVGDSSMSAAERVLGKTIEENMRSLVAYGPGNADMEDVPAMLELREAVMYLSGRVEKIEDEVTAQLRQCTRDSPLSTVLLMSDDLSNITDESVRLGLVLRILRYVSPFPWGSTRAEAGRRKDSLTRTINALWGNQRHKFLSGGGVLWTPVVVRRSGAIKIPEVAMPKDVKGWLASRQPPPISSNEADPAVLDITQAFRSASLNKTALELLYDCRFLLRFQPHVLSHKMLSLLEGNTPLARIVIAPEARFCLPQVIWRTGRDEDMILAMVRPSGTISYSHPSVVEKDVSIRPDFVNAQWIRCLDADLPWRGSAIPMNPLSELNSRDSLPREKTRPRRITSEPRRQVIPVKFFAPGR